MNLKLLKSFSVYTIAGFFGTGANFLVLPILSRYLTPIDYGVQAIINSYVLILIPLIGIVASGYLSVEYYKMPDKKEYASLFSSVQLIPVIPFFLFFILSILFHEPLGKLMEIPEGSTYMTWTIPLLAIFTIYIESFFAYLVIRKQANLYFIFNITRTLLEILLTILLIVKFDMGWHGRIYAWLIATAVFFLVSAIYFYRQNLFTFDIKLKYYKAGLLYGAPLIIYTVGKFTSGYSDRIFIANIVGIGDVGYYNMAYQIAGIILIFINVFQKVHTPFVYERLNELNEKRKLEILQLSYAFMGLLLFAFVAVSVASPFLFGNFIDEKYRDSIPYISWICLSHVFWGVFQIFAVFIQFYRKSQYMAYISIVNIIINLILNYFLITEFGVIGAAYATCISYLISLVLVSYYTNKLVDLPWLSFRLVYDGFVNKLKRA
ncbi:lipopolysaccharide biosynthesis protein [Adhaeribacter soli]|uniref:Oligosaccharide flippase family protein n=1 Tax=Adhaeribacter soli TaxID=2607655 RepID=A0A5N1IL29_9BACT|nr:oligosaccharide flippase family protein [Adhaeribacter soli]KAA9327391.1 oligosaccharide flippase family protein [Adhaeribacter soli]